MDLRVSSLKWKKASSYRVLDIPDPSVARASTRRTIISENTEPAPHIVPLTKEDPYEAAVSPKCTLCLALANTVTLESMNAKRLGEWSAQACIFAMEWGLLHAPTGAQPVADFVAHARNLRSAIDAVKDGKGDLSKLGIDKHLARGDVRLEASGALSLRVNNLLGLCWVELIEAAQRSDVFFNCAICGKFGIHPRWGRHREYCSGACRKAAERQRTRNARS